MIFTVRICCLGELQGVGGGQVGVGRRDRQDEAGVPADVGHDHVFDLLSDVGGLVANGHLRQPRQIDQCYVEN